MQLELSTKGFQNLVEIQVYLKNEFGLNFNSEEVVEYLLQNAINHVKKEETHTNTASSIRFDET